MDETQPHPQTGLVTNRDTPRIATSGALMIGVKPVPPIPPRLEILKVPPLHVVQPQGLGACFFGQICDRCGQFPDSHPIRIPDNRHHQTIRRVHCKSNVVVLLENEILDLGIQ